MRRFGGTLLFAALLTAPGAARAPLDSVFEDDFEWGSVCAWANDFWYPDLDEDGFGDAGDPGAPSGCPSPPGAVGNALDCDDGSSAVHPLAAEACNGIDDDCDSLLDAADPGLVRPACEDQDGVCGGAQKPASLCATGAWSPCGSLQYSEHSAFYELPESSCDGLDNDCDGVTDETCPARPALLQLSLNATVSR